MTSWRPIATPCAPTPPRPSAALWRSTARWTRRWRRRSASSALPTTARRACSTRSSSRPRTRLRASRRSRASRRICASSRRPCAPRAAPRCGRRAAAGSCRPPTTWCPAASSGPVPPRHNPLKSRWRTLCLRGFASSTWAPTPSPSRRARECLAWARGSPTASSRPRSRWGRRATRSRAPRLPRTPSFPLRAATAWKWPARRAWASSSSPAAACATRTPSTSATSTV
mmetsp:Transcript_5342/g.16277  ORF Transcript_5342/g.16277 Transcript_5342/m.16277 type:complete len:227 (-) Transcript_5342:100-780(-)